MGFFENLHDPAFSNVLDGQTTNPAFDKYYSDHIRKLLAVRKANRYLAKGNYNISRLAYLHRLFPNARFLIPVRNPQHHIASQIKQHELFSRADALDSRVGRQLGLSGHFEFGPDRRPVHFGNDDEANAIQSAWAGDREIEGWARYWAATYRFIFDLMEQDPRLAKQCFLFRYEDLCTESEAVIDALLDHCNLGHEAFSESKTRYASLLTLPDYYRPNFSESDRAQIETHCMPVYRSLEKRIWRA